LNAAAFNKKCPAVVRWPVWAARGGVGCPDQIFPAAISVMLGGWWSMKTRFKSFMLSFEFNRIFGCSVDPHRYGFIFRMSTDLLFFGSRCILIIAAQIAAV